MKASTLPLHRCAWSETDPLLQEYHDTVWGVPVHEDRLLFEILNLEGAQAGLSWLTVLKRRTGYQKAFDKFNAKKIIQYDAKKIAELMQNKNIIRNRLKINAVIENAKAYLAVQKEWGSFDAYIWQFKNKDHISKDLKKRGFRFVGPTICYAFMQAIGIVNDHSKDCFRKKLV
jgi:DNA-3-methyladenine glycosylase I